MLDARPANARLHEPRGGSAQDNFAMIINVVGMRVADEDALHLWIVRVQP
jgi:hypothetical protein